MIINVDKNQATSDALVANVWRNMVPIIGYIVTRSFLQAQLSHPWGRRFILLKPFG